MAESYEYAKQIRGASTQSTSLPTGLTPTNYISDSLMHSVGLYTRNEINEARFNRFSRFGRVLDPHGRLNDCREYLFFVKPDLHIVIPYGQYCAKGGRSSQSASDIYRISGWSAASQNPDLLYTNNGMTLNPQLGGNAYFRDLLDTHPEVIKELQVSANRNADPFCHLLSFGVNNYLDIGGSESSTLDNPSTIFGTNYEYLKDSEESDESPSFSLEFIDNKFLDTYHFFKAYSEYHIARKSGLITPPNTNYYRYKRLHNTMGVYKFIVAEDMETIIYWAYVWGIYPISCPREAFSDPLYSDGLSFSVNFKGAFVEDMNPLILHQFNQLMFPVMDQYKLNKDKWLPVVNKEYYDGSVLDAKNRYTNRYYQPGYGDHIDGTLPKAALVDGRKSIGAISSDERYKYRLRWYA